MLHSGTRGVEVYGAVFRYTMLHSGTQGVEVHGLYLGTQKCAQVYEVVLSYKSCILVLEEAYQGTRGGVPMGVHEAVLRCLRH
jgi:hypothetical protein